MSYKQLWKVWDVCVGYPGNGHSARVLRQPHLLDVLSGPKLIGDLAYQMLMKPLSDTGGLTPELYNYRLSSACSVMEMASGRLNR